MPRIYPIKVRKRNSRDALSIINEGETSEEAECEGRAGMV